jgi:hypothetical protein
MAHPVVYPGDFPALLRKWEEQAVADEKNGTHTVIANGECARLPEALTSVGHTSRWQPGERVIDVARTLKPGTVIANFVFKNGKARYPNQHGYHAALFVRGEGFSMATSKPRKIWMFDQWAGKSPHTPGLRFLNVYSPEQIRQMGRLPCDDASAFYVVLVP